MKRAFLISALAACSSRVDVLGSTSSGTTSDASTTSTTTDTSTSTTGPITGADDATSYNIINEPDLGADADCDPWLQDCPPGQKCTPSADDADTFWTTIRCRPIAPDPKQPGEPCSVEGWPFSGIDDCGVGSMCWSVDFGVSFGECVAWCQGGEANPFCPDACTFCNQTGDPLLSVCLPMCDPFAQNCGEGRACYPIYDLFACAPDYSGRDGMAGDACEYFDCDPGLFCADAELVPDCDGVGCCTAYCDLDDLDSCNALLPGTVCTPLSGPGQAAETCLMNDRIGACMVPQ